MNFPGRRGGEEAQLEVLKMNVETNSVKSTPEMSGLLRPEGLEANAPTVFSAGLS